MNEVINSLNTLREEILDHEEKAFEQIKKHRYTYRAKIDIYKACMILAELEEDIFNIIIAEQKRLSGFDPEA